jgi:hypothetical protein
VVCSDGRIKKTGLENDANRQSTGGSDSHLMKSAGDFALLRFLTRHLRDKRRTSTQLVFSFPSEFVCQEREPRWCLASGSPSTYREPGRPTASIGRNAIFNNRLEADHGALKRVVRAKLPLGVAMQQGPFFSHRSERAGSQRNHPRRHRWRGAPNSSSARRPGNNIRHQGSSLLRSSHWNRWDNNPRGLSYVR